MFRSTPQMDSQPANQSNEFYSPARKRQQGGSLTEEENCMNSRTETQTYPARFEWLDAVHRCSHLHPKTKNIGWAIYHRADKATLKCWPNLSLMDQDLGGPGSSKNVSRHVHALEAAGFVKVAKEMHGGRLSSNYTLIEQGSDWECPGAHHDLEKSDLYPQKASLDGKSAGLDVESAGLDGDGLTLSITHSLTPSQNTLTNTFTDEPSAHSLETNKSTMDSRENGGSLVERHVG